MCLEDGEVLGCNAEGHVVAVDGFEGFALGYLHLGDVGVGEGIADVVGGESEGLTEVVDGFVVVLLLGCSEALLDVGLVGLGA